MVGILKLLGAKEVVDQLAGSAEEVKGPGLLKQAGSLGWAAIKTAYSPSSQNHISQWNQNRISNNQYRQDTNEQRRYQDNFLKRLDLVMNGTSLNASSGRNITKMNYVVDRTAEDLFSRAVSSFTRLSGNFERFTLDDVRGNDAGQVTLQVNANFRKISAQISSINSALKIKTDELIKSESMMNDRMAKLASIQQSQAQRFNAQVDANLNTIESTLSQLSLKIDLQDRQLDMLAHRISIGGGNSSLGLGKPGPISTGIANTANRFLPKQSFGDNPAWFLAASALSNPTILATLSKLATGAGIASLAVDWQKLSEESPDEKKARWEKEGFTMMERLAWGGGYDHPASKAKAEKFYREQKILESKIQSKMEQGLSQEKALQDIAQEDKAAKVERDYAKKRDQIRQKPDEGEPWGLWADPNLKGTGDESLMGEKKSNAAGQARGGAYLGGGISGSRVNHKEMMKHARLGGMMPSIPNPFSFVKDQLFGVPEQLPSSVPEKPVDIETKDFEIKSQNMIHIESQQEITLISRSKIVLDAPEIEFKTDRFIFPETMNLSAKESYAVDGDNFPGTDGTGSSTKSEVAPGFKLGEKLGQSMGITPPSVTPSVPPSGGQFQKLDDFIKGRSPAGVAAGGEMTDLGTAGSKWGGTKNTPYVGSRDQGSKSQPTPNTKNPTGRGGISGGGGGFTSPVPEKLGGKWLGGDTRGLPTEMVTVLEDAAKYLPEGYTVKMMSGVGSRPSSKSYHPRGLAGDVQIFDENGKKLDWYQNKETFRIYESYAQNAKKIQTEKFPNGNLVWGGYFWNGGPGNYGFADLMHMQWGGKTGGGDWEKGANEGMQKWLGPDGKSVGMGDISKYELPKTTADLKLGQPTGPAVAQPPQPPQVQAKPDAVPEVPIKDRSITSHAGLKSPQDPNVKMKVDRSNFAAQLKDPRVLAAFAGRMNSEVGGQGPDAQLAFAEEVFNRAQARNQTLMQALSGNYYPTSRPGSSNNPKLQSIIMKAYAEGTDTIEGATGNASGSVGFGYPGGQRNPKNVGKKIGGERFGLEANDRNWKPTYVPVDPNVAAIHQTNAGREVPGIPTPQAVAKRHYENTLNDPTTQYRSDSPYKGRGGTPSPRTDLLPPDKPPPPAFGFGKKFGEAVLPKPHGRGTPGMPMVKKEDLPKPKGPPKPGDLSGRASRDKNPRQETRATQTAEEKARAARGGAYAGGGIATQEKETGVRGDSGTPPPDTGTDIRNPRNDTGDSNPPAPGDDGTGSYDSICYV